MAKKVKPGDVDPDVLEFRARIRGGVEKRLHALRSMLASTPEDAELRKLIRVAEKEIERLGGTT